MIMEDYLKQFHTRFPGCTSDVQFTTYTDTGKTSYELLSDLVPTDFTKSVQVLDIACGDGYLLQRLHLRRQPGLKLFGIDMTPAELNKAKDRIGSGDIQNVDLQIGRVQQLPYSDNTMDYVFCHMAFMLMNAIEDVLAEVRRVLKL